MSINRNVLKGKLQFALKGLPMTHAKKDMLIDAVLQLADEIDSKSDTITDSDGSVYKSVTYKVSET